MKGFVINEYDRILGGLVVYPSFFDVVDINNKYRGTINRNLVIDQYNTFVNVLINEDIKVNFLNLMSSPSQLYTRDLGFVIKDIFFISNLKDPIRKDEVKVLIDFLKNYGGKIHIMSHNVEGGDVILHNDKLFIGVGGRSTEAAVNEIVQVLDKNHIYLEMVKVIFDTSKIHLDCVFNVLDEKSCIITDYIFNVEVIKRHFTNIIKIEKEDADSLAANIVNLGNGKIICSNKSLVSLLKDYDYTPIYIDFSEIIKAQGGLGCCIFPTCRQHFSVKEGL
ncbi:N-Dimethylarginine dimethylaminohydrolase [Natronincola peptidivorans]|uniref:N-Dimethylarginine dimethylaminohydrolase n=1 Tax=Natronincola peptidivorans TaxID=426128 RepID=A0A1I0GN75_9FIRM|nr:arginine deiminase family protein [Natronincola peptidivorans]SET72746.1 N-Dimethylarginine dimethylaminohydrolase [Natronincola peptidivorans]